MFDKLPSEKIVVRAYQQDQDIAGTARRTGVKPERVREILEDYGFEFYASGPMIDVAAEDSGAGASA